MRARRALPLFALIRSDVRLRSPFASLWLCAFALNVALACFAEAAPGTNVDGSWPAEPLRLEITMSPQSLAALRSAPRQYVTARVKDGAMIFENVAIHLKGAIGSFRPIDDKPSFTLNFSRDASNLIFRGTSKIHLNNSVEDPSYLNEKLGTLIFSKAGIPAPAVHHALVELNGRRLGLYVLKEGFTPEFLARNFKTPTGNLYDIDTGHEVTDDMQRDLGSGPNDRADLKQLAEAVQLPDSNERWTRLQQVLDVDEFVSFMATEIMICHRDGYSLARNNYRLYHPDNGRFIFLPHGMDQLFGPTNFPGHPSMAGLVAQVVMSNPEGDRLYRHRLHSLLTNVFDVTALTNEVDRTIAALAPALTRSEANAVRRAARDLKSRIVARKSFLQAELASLAPELNFDAGAALLTNWTPVNPSNVGVLSLDTAPDVTPSLHIRAGSTTAASWQQRIALERGKYRFEARARTEGVKPLPFGKHSGACIRITGANPPQEQRLLGDHAWTSLAAEFTVSGGTQEIVLLCELRASKGQVWFDRSSLKLRRLDSGHTAP